MKQNRLGVAALVVVVSVLALFGMIRIPPVDVPWHIATGRFILGHGSFPVTNTFSWTFPDHPLHQQYPLFQVPLALIVDGLGWEAVTLANLIAWTAVGLVWMAFAGTWREAARQPLLWFLVVLGVQRHLVARPEVLTWLFLGCMLVCLDRWRRHARPGWWVGVVAVQWAMVNSHQMWPLGLAIQLSFLLHLGIVRAVGGRFGIDPTDRALPLLPPLVGLLASIGVLSISPLGLDVYTAPLTTLDTLLSQGQTQGVAQAAELRPVWSDPLATLLAGLLVAVAATWLVRARREIVPFDLAVFAMGVLLILMAVRGMPIVALACGSIAGRTRARVGPWLPEESPLHVTAALTTVVLALLLVIQVGGAPPTYFAIQRGFGRSIGEWGDGVVTFLRSDPPPGRMLNLGWVVGNPMIYGTYPEQQVFVDPRWETYPRAFLLENIAALDDRARLEGLITRWKPGFVVAEMRLPSVQTRVAELCTSGWVMAYADTEHVVLVPETTDAAWLGRHPPIAPAAIAPVDWLVDHPTLHAQQQIRVARLLLAFGENGRARSLLAEARARSDHPLVKRDLDRVELP